jgi:hypothetical protein
MLKLGLSSNGQIEVLAGLNGTEKVVLEGIDRLSEGKEVQIVADDQPHPCNGISCWINHEYFTVLYFTSSRNHIVDASTAV